MLPVPENLNGGRIKCEIPEYTHLVVASLLVSTWATAVAKPFTRCRLGLELRVLMYSECVPNGLQVL